MKILLLSRYDTTGASSRYRSYQFLPFLQELGIDVEPFPLFDQAYLKSRYTGKAIPGLRVLTAYLQRLGYLLASHKYDLVWVEKELFPWMPAWAELFLKLKVPYVVDYDDAIFHRYDTHRHLVVRKLLGCKIDRVMRHAALVIAGNNYLAKRATQAGASRVEILPTVIDLNRYPIPSSPPDNSKLTIGWIGSPSPQSICGLSSQLLSNFVSKHPRKSLLSGRVP